MLGRLRRQVGMTQVEVGYLLGTYQSAVSNIEYRKHIPKLPTLENYLDALGYDLHIIATKRQYDDNGQRKSPVTLQSTPVRD